MRDWKSFERYVAKIIGGKRIPVGVRIQGRSDPGDVLLPPFFVECKHQGRWQIKKWMRDTITKAKKQTRIPLLVVSSQEDIPPLVIFRLRDWKLITED